MGRSSMAEQAALTRSVVGSSPTAPATPPPIYINFMVTFYDPVSGQTVNEHWWPGDPLP